MESQSSHDARQSLDAIGESRHDIAARLTTPRWYYPLLGALVAQMILVYGLVGNTHGLLGNFVSVLSALLVAVGSGWLVGTYSARTGLVARFPSAARSRLGLAAFALGILVPTLVVVFAESLPTTTVVVLALAAFTSTVLLGPAYDALYRADVRRDGAR